MRKRLIRVIWTIWGGLRKPTVTDWLLAVFSGALVIATVKLWHSTDRNVEAARDAAILAKETLVASQRAWIRIDQIKLAGAGLTFDKLGANADVSFKITNVGNTPAVHVVPHPWMIVLSSALPYPEQAARCEQVRKQPFGPGFTLFPNESNAGGIERGIHVNVDAKDITSVGSYNEVHLFVIGCIDYTFQTDLSVHHQTPFVLALVKNSPPYAVSPSVVEGTSPASGLALVDPFAGMGSLPPAD
jgi:hypothetical protein